MDWPTLNAAYPGKMTLRISLDHHSAKMHDLERGDGSFEKTLIGMRWLRDAGIKMAVAGRTLWDETDMQTRARVLRPCIRPTDLISTPMRLPKQSYFPK